MALLVATVSSAGVARASGGGEASSTQRFCWRATSRNFEIACDQELALEPYLDVAETTLARTRAWLGLGGAPPPGPTQIYLTRDASGVMLVEHERGLDTSPARQVNPAFRGRCFPQAHLIVVPCDAASLRWQVAHEVTHLVFHEVVGRNVEIVNEGLAELLPYWILFGASETPETVDAGYELYDRRIAQAVLAREVPSFEAFMNVDEATFYDERANWLWYALSWQLAKVLVESPSVQIRGRVRRFLDALGTGMPAMSALQSVYDARAVEAAWQAAIDAVAPWRPLFGDWRTENSTLIGAVAGPHSACVVSAETLFAGQPFTLEAALEGAPGRNAAFGFAFDVSGDDDFAYVEFRPGCGRIAVAERECGAWTRVEDDPFDPLVQAALLDPAHARRITLRATSRGQLAVLVDGVIAFRYELGRPLRGGSAGVMFENCDARASESEMLEMRFGAVTLAY